jgi:hypothetical protein
MPVGCNCSDSVVRHLHCSVCGAVVDTHSAIYNDRGHVLCMTCWVGDSEDGVNCRVCHERIEEGDLWRTIHIAVLGDDVCHLGCVEGLLRARSYQVCDICYTIYAAGSTCPFCEESTQTIRDYSYTPAELCFHDTPNSSSELFFGIELEIERCDAHYGPMDNNTRSHTAGLSLVPNWCYTKYDSSVRFGFEIVTHPMSLSWMQTEIHTLVDNFRTLRDLGYRSADVGTCGMHIHMSKIAFTHAQLYKFMYMVYAHPSFSLLLSQRSMASFERWASPFASKYDYTTRAKTKHQGQRSRHDAVNISNKPTIELRIFAGTLNPLTFHKNIETAIAMYRFAKDTPFHGITITGFIDYVMQNKFLYPHLDIFLQDKGNRTDLFCRDTPTIPDTYRKSLVERGILAKEGV